MLNFNDGVSIDTSGELRILSLKDGDYVVGEGMCIPVKDAEEGEKTIQDIKKRRTEREKKDNS